MARELDNVDRGILYMLQLDARNTTSQDIAEKVGVSPSTIRNRIDALESDGIIEGYHPEIDYEAANMPLRVLFVASADPEVRSAAVDRMMDIQGVVDVREMLTSTRNLHVEVIGRDTSDLVRITEAIHDIDVDVESSELVKQRQVRPFNHFYFSEALGDLNPTDDETGE